jgi:glycerol-1-phosphate dehydrogenase [NAD(P)+]
MTLWPRLGKLKASPIAALSFLSPCERLIASLPVENMHTKSQRKIGRGVLSAVGESVRSVLPGAKRLLLVGDDATLDAAGRAVAAALEADFTVTVHSLGAKVKARVNTAEMLAEMGSGHDLFLAVGSGTINDLVKYAAALRNLPYCAVMTATSMNGYSAANASLEDASTAKRSYPAAPPVLVIADLEVLAAAPGRLTRAGIGDTLCRSVVEADMIISHHVIGTPYPKAFFDRARLHEPILLTGTIHMQQIEEPFLQTLVTALLDSGDAMTEFGSSAPASQGEHMIVHTLEMKYGSELTGLFHGELVSVASVTLANLQQRILLSLPTLRPMPYTIEQFQRNFGKARAEALYALYNHKLMGAEQARDTQARLHQQWPAIKEELSTRMLSAATLERALIHSGLPTQPQVLNIAEERYRFACSYAHLTRERFTFLDLAAMGTKRVV